jgi:hypothetical protein
MDVKTQRVFELVFGKPLPKNKEEGIKRGQEQLEILEAFNAHMANPHNEQLEQRIQESAPSTTWRD